MVVKTVDEEVLKMFMKQYPHLDTLMATMILTTPVEKLDEIMNKKISSNEKFQKLPVTETILYSASIINPGDLGYEELANAPIPDHVNNLNLIVD